MASDVAVSLGGSVLSNFELNVAKPLIAYNNLQSIRLLSDACTSFMVNCVLGIRINSTKLDEYEPAPPALPLLDQYDPAAHSRRCVHTPAASAWFAHHVHTQPSGSASVNRAGRVKADRRLPSARIVRSSLMLVTALSPFVGYDAASRIAEKAHTENMSLKVRLAALAVQSPRHPTRRHTPAHHYAFDPGDGGAWGWHVMSCDVLQDAGIALKLLTAEQFDEWVQPEHMTNSPAFAAPAKL